MKIIKKIKILLENKRGELSFVFVFGMIFVFWLIMLVIDLFRITSIHLDATSMMREVVDIISTQGGVSKEVPDQYPNKSTYTTSERLTRFVHDTMLNAGIEDGDIFIIETRDSDNNVVVPTTEINRDTNLDIDYGNPIEVRLRYKINLISLPDNSPLDNLVLNITRRTTSKYKHRNGTVWEGDSM